MIIVCSLSDLINVCQSVKPKFVISVIDPGYAPETPNGVKHHLKLGFDDIVKISSDNKIFRQNKDEIPQTLPAENHVDSIIEFTKKYEDNDHIVIHCWCGVSRSMATATYLYVGIILQQLNKILSTFVVQRHMQIQINY